MNKSSTNKYRIIKKFNPKNEKEFIYIPQIKRIFWRSFTIKDFNKAELPYDNKYGYHPCDLRSKKEMIPKSVFLTKNEKLCFRDEMDCLNFLTLYDKTEKFSRISDKHESRLKEKTIIPVIHSNI